MMQADDWNKYGYYQHEYGSGNHGRGNGGNAGAGGGHYQGYYGQMDDEDYMDSGDGHVAGSGTGPVAGSGGGDIGYRYNPSRPGRRPSKREYTTFFYSTAMSKIYLM